MMAKRILSCFVLCVFMASCQWNAPKFEEKIVEEQSGDCELACASVFLNYLECKRPAHFADNYNKLICSRVVDFILSNQGEPGKPIDSLTSVAKAVQLFMKEYDDLHEHFHEIPSYELMLSDSISFRNDKMLSVASKTYSFLGGAHGYSSTVYLNFDMTNGNLIANDSLFTDVAQFKKIAESEFRIQQNITEERLINENGFWFDNDTFQLSQSIGFDEQNVLLNYNPYEIASYAQGAIIIRIPLEKVKNLLRHIE